MDKDGTHHGASLQSRYIYGSFFLSAILHFLAQKAQDQVRKHEHIAACVTTMAVKRLICVNHMTFFALT